MSDKNIHEKEVYLHKIDMANITRIFYIAYFETLHKRRISCIIILDILQQNSVTYFLSHILLANNSLPIHMFLVFVKINSYIYIPIHMLS